MWHCWNLVQRGTREYYKNDTRLRLWENTAESAVGWMEVHRIHRARLRVCEDYSSLIDLFLFLLVEVEQIASVLTQDTGLENTKHTKISESGKATGIAARWRLNIERSRGFNLCAASDKEYIFSFYLSAELDIPIRLCVITTSRLDRYPRGSKLPIRLCDASTSRLDRYPRSSKLAIRFCDASTSQFDRCP